MKNEDFLSTSLTANECILVTLDSYLSFVDYVLDVSDNEELLKVAQTRKEDWSKIRQIVEKQQNKWRGYASKKKGSDA